MNLTEIIAEIDDKYPNAVSNASKVRKINNLQLRLYRKMKKQTYVDYAIVPDQPTYPLVMNIDDVFQVMVDGERYFDKRINDSALCSNFYSFVGTTTGDWIDIYPTPDSSKTTLTLWHYEVPAALSESSLGTTPTLDHDYHMLFVYYVCKEIAENNRDFDISAGYSQQYSQMEREMFASFQKPEVILVHNESGW